MANEFQIQVLEDNTDTLFEMGYAGPFSLEGLDLVSLAADIDRHVARLAWPNQHYARDLDQHPWFKSFHTLATDYIEVARHPKLLEILRSVFQDRPVKLWGTAPLIKQAGAVHRWHSDIETRCWPTLTVWLGIKNVNQLSSLQVITRTHKLEQTPDVLRRRGIPMETSEQVLQAAQALDPDCELLVPDMKDGDCLIFLGTMWHGTHNTSAQNRYAVTIQYCDVDVEVKVPINFEIPVRWHSQKPQCINIDVDK